MTELKLWCYLKGDTDVFKVSILSSQDIDDLKKRIHTKNPKSFARCDAKDLKLTLTDVALALVKGDIRNGQYRPNASDRQLGSRERISAVWPEQPSYDNLHVFITPPPGGKIPILIGEMPKVPHVAEQQILVDICVKVMELGKFKFSDLASNKIEETTTDPPAFVTDFVRLLDRKPIINPSYITGLNGFGIAVEHFESSQDSTTGETRYAGLIEVLHTACYVAPLPWEKFWQSRGGHKNPLKEREMASVFFNGCYFAPKNGTVVADQNKDWPLYVVVKRDNDEDREFRQFRPRSDYLISTFSLPRLLVEINSTPAALWPMDLIRMLTTGAYIVRFANKVVPAFQQKKNFVLCAIFLWDNGEASRYVLYQQLNDDRIFWDLKMISLNDPNGRVTFVRYLYNLRALEDEDPNTKALVDDLNGLIKGLGLKSLYPNVDSKKENMNKRARTGTGSNGDNAYGGGGSDPMELQLRAHGFEVNLETVIDYQGIPWDLIEKPDNNVLTVYRPLDPNKEFIAKKVRKGSDELEILRLLDTIKPKSCHIISLFDAFDEWIVLPKMDTVKSYVRTASTKLGREVVQVCSGLIDGLEYLHRHGIAHRDIKPDNLVVDEEFRLQIIDFDIAMRVKDEDEEVYDQCGTEGWMAPEVAKKLRHSPIKADRWACGRMILFLLNTFKKWDESLGTFARNLCNGNPELRPRLLLFGYMAPPHSDIGSVQAANRRKVIRPRQELMKVDGENKKRKLSVGLGLSGNAL